jgi:hypothetical protein
VFLGYSSSHLSYHSLAIASQRIYIFRHVCFHEHVFPFNIFEQIAQSTSHSPSDLAILPNLLISPLFHSHMLATSHLVHSYAPPSHTPVSTHPQQPNNSPHPSPRACLSNNHTAGIGIGLTPALQPIRSILLGSPGCPIIVSPLSCSDASAVNSASVSTDGLSLVVDLFSYSLQQDPPSYSPLHASPPMVSRHPMVLHSGQLKTTNLIAFSAITDTPTSRVVSPPAYEPLTFFDVDRYDT